MTFHLLNTALISLLLVCVAVLPVAAAGFGEGSGESAGSGSGSGDGSWPESARPYYSPDVARCFDGNAAGVEERLKEVVPAEYLPDSLQPKEQYKPQQSAAPGSMSGAGAGGWTDLSRAYIPSTDPDVLYGAYSRGGLDSSARLHWLYSRAVRTDISQIPDVAGFRTENLEAYHYSEYSDGSWSSQVAVAPVSGLEDSDILLFAVDSDDYLHLVYSKWTWGRDPNDLVGDWNAYQHQDENIWYRYRTPAGPWSDPVRLTSYSGDWGIQGADFRLVNNRIYGTWVTVLNRETVPSSYRAQVGFIDGLTGAWSDIEVLSQWDYNEDPGQLTPYMWPSVGVSDQGGEVAVTYGTSTFSGVITGYRSDIHGAVRGTGGAWSAVQNITSAADNQVWVPIFAFYGTGNKARVFAVRFNYWLDATHPPEDNYYFIYHAGGEWQAPANITRASPEHVGTAMSLRLDPFDDMHVLYAITTYAWDGGAGAWMPQGNRLRYTREAGGGLSTPEILHDYEVGRYVGDTELVIDRDGGRHALFQTYREAGGVMSEFNVYYACSAPDGTGGAFPAPVKLRGDVDNEIFSPTLSTFPGGEALASWFEKRFSGAGVPEVGVMYSRMWDGSEWSGSENVTDVAGSADIVHATAVGWSDYTDQRSNDRGEQQCVFETAKYNEVTGEYYGFNKYFIETVNGTWTAPELISGLEFAGEYPGLFSDGNQRYFMMCESEEAGAGKEVLYATMQPDPTPPATTCYFAEGTTRAGFEEWICIQNPGDEAADVSITYMLETGENIVEGVLVGAHSRTTVNIRDAVGPEHDVSAKVEGDRLIVAERPMYFDYRGWQGGHDAVGALNTSRLWYFAEGTTRSGFAEYLTLQNPADRNATVDVTYVLDDGTTITEPVSVGARSRATVDVNAVVGEGRDVSMVVKCDDVAIVAERPMYFDYNGWTGGHNAMGANSLANRWYFAEGTTRSGFDTYLCVGNPYGIDADVTMRFVLGDGAEVIHTLNVPATSRRTVKVNDVVGEGNDVSAVIDSTSPVLIERPMYFNYREKWTGGHVAMGARSPKNSWFFAEGTTRDGFEEWLSLENPGMMDATADISYMLEDGSVTDTTVAVPAHTRVTVDVPLAVGPGRDVSVAVWSDIAIIVERPMYFLYHGMWPGGHDVVGL
ncbi:MAG: hypothetical protein KJ920_07785 [Actinobacteria bacterium]|nr:hypothetical protein [Actinomycetota bacterium]